jgi:uncharacterized protein (DUF983 family)
MSRSYLGAALANRCPRCREGKLFIVDGAYKKNSTKMHERCPVCGQPTEIEVGFYYGTGYVSYALSIALLVSTFVAWKVLSWFVSYDPDWKIHPIQEPERVNKEQMNNW